MKILYLVLIIFLLEITSSFSQSPSLNIGIKLGFKLGEKNPFDFGLETSYNVRNIDDLQSGSLLALSRFQDMYGLVCDYEWFNHTSILHLGLQTGYSIAGLDIGPSLYFKDKEVYTGITANTYCGVIIIPYFGINYFPQINENLNQLGLFMKIPIGFSKSTKFSV